MAKPIKRQEAVSLRKQGFSYSYIQKQTGVSKSTLSIWLKSIPSTPNPTVTNNILQSRQTLIDGRRRLKSESLKEAAALAEKDIGELSKRDMYMLGLGIYMGEGSKTSCIRIVNSDLWVIKTSISWFKKIYGLPNENFAIRLHLYPDSDIYTCHKYWSLHTGIPMTQFHPAHIDNRRDKKLKSKRKLPFGTAHVTIRSGGNREFGILLMRRILSSLEIVKNKAGLV